MDWIPKFFKIFLVQISSQKLHIPSEFVTHMKGALPNKAVLHNRNGKFWLITISKDGDEFFLGDGWPKFVKDNGVEQGDCLVFDYDGQSIFDVKIYGLDGCEKESISPDSGFQMANEVVDELENEDESGDENTDQETDDTYVSESEYEEEMEERDFEVENSRNRKGKGIESSQAAKRFGNVKMSTTTAGKTRGRPRDDDDEVFKHGIVSYPKNPYFVAKLRTSRENELHIPLDVFRDFNLQLPDKLNIVDEENRSWEAYVVLWEDGRTWLTNGWRAFRKWNNLKSVDRCICEFVQGEGDNGMHLKMTILRDGSWLPKENK